MATNNVKSNIEKCQNEQCKYTVHSNNNITGGTHCCLACKLTPSKHGPRCEKNIFGKLLYFSFSLYGDNSKYTRGMIENAKTLNDKFPNAVVKIYVASDVPKNITTELLNIPNVRIKNVERKNGTQNSLDRFETIDEADCAIMIVRDADSRTHERDIACIEDFIESNKLLHIIRDHRLHNAKILAGLWGLRKSALKTPISVLMKDWFSKNNNVNKGIDQHFLANYIYPLLVKSALIHDRVGFFEEKTLHTPFRKPIVDRLFCGQIHCFDKDGKEYLRCPQ